MSQQAVDTWLHGSADETAELIHSPYPDGGLDLYPVSNYVNKPENDGPKCIKRIDLVEDEADEPGATQGTLF